MAQRPKLWIHRTRRFWVGAGVLLLLIGTTATFGFCVFRATIALPAESNLKIGIWQITTAHGIATHEGGIIYWREATIIDDSRTQFDFAARYQRPRYRWLPGHISFPPELGADPAFFLPLWPLPVLWAIFWITRMVRAERRELKKFSEPDA
ncbi:hypothetical protein [Haloferula sp. A504]|uniref:hypothetical protein n=1 Tax=Haloferula sp. A504 TaxID=3373601 RepID=UPI0031C498D0|nr:hypothetical protein [Verrucomicrobiaceae bacterium E54]